ncbi:MAG: tetratricopeptide repeat protein, partial [Bacteroidota bacterium]
MRVALVALLLFGLVPLPGAAQVVSSEAAEVRAQQLLVRGLTRAYLDDHEEALILFTEALRYEPQQASLLSAAARSYEAVGDATNARFYAAQAVEQAPDARFYQEELAQLHLRLGETDEAVATYRQLVDRFPDALDVRFELARLQILSGAYEEAVTTYEDLLTRTAEVEAVYVQLLQLYARLGDDGRTEAALRGLIEAAPDAAEYHRMLGDLLRQRSAYEEAASTLEEALRLAPADVATALVLGDVYEALGDSTRAAALLDQTLDTEGASADALVARATPLYARSEIDPAAADVAARLLEQALNQDPAQTEALLMLGDLRYRAEQYEEAAPLLYQAVQANPRDLQIWTQAAAAYLQSGAPLRAADVADEALLLFPGQFSLLRLAAYGLMDGYRSDAALRRFEEALAVLREEAPGQTTEASDLVASMAMLHSRKQNTTASDSLYAEALALDPENVLALNNFAYSLAGRGERLDEALDMAQRAVDLNPGTASFYDTLGWVHYQRGTLEEAEQWIREALDAGGASALVYEHMGDVLHRQGRTDEARPYWQQALDLNP